MTASVSVTEVRNAMRCPRIFALGREGGQRVAFPVGASSLGSTFHRVVEGLHRVGAKILEPLAEGTSVEGVASALRVAVIDLLAAELEASPTLATMPAELDELADALRALADYVATGLAELGPSRPSAAFEAFSAAAELEISDLVDVGGGDAVILAGRLDALHQRHDRIEVVEYKLTSEANDELDRAQVALYRHLLREAVELDAHPVVLRFEPTMRTTELSPEEADALVSRRLLPLVRDMAGWLADPQTAPPPSRNDLCPVCPVRAACVAAYPEPLASRDEPPSGATRPRPDPFGRVQPVEAPPPSVTAGATHDEAGADEARELAKHIEAAFRQAHVVVQMKPPTIGPRLVTFEISAPRGRIRKVDAAAEDVEHHLASDHEVTAVYRRRGGIRTFEVARRTPRRVTLAPLLHAKRDWLSERPGRFVLGEDARGRPVVGDFGDHVSCHMLVGGSAGSGKSVLLRAIATSLVYFHPPSSIRLTLVDPKRVTFGGELKSRLAAHLAEPVCYDTEGTLQVLERLAEEMDERYGLFEAAQVEDCETFNEQAAPGDRLARHVVIVDEFADLTVDKALREAFFAAVRRLGNMARAAGIHLVLATQRPDAKTVPGMVRTNLSAKVALRVPNQVSSRIILDQGGAETLLGNGDLLADLGHGLIRAQGAMA